MNAINLLRGLGLVMLLVTASHAAAPVEILFQSVELSSEAQLTSAFGSENSYQRTTLTSPLIGQAQRATVATANLAGVSEIVGTEFTLSPELDSSLPRMEVRALLSADTSIPLDLSPTNITSLTAGYVSLSLNFQITRPMRLTISLASQVAGSMGGIASYTLSTSGGSQIAASTSGSSQSGTNQTTTILGAGTYGLGFHSSAYVWGQIAITPDGWFINQPSGTNEFSLNLEFEQLPDELAQPPRFALRQGSENQVILDIAGLLPGQYYYVERAASLAPGNWNFWTSFQAASSAVSMTDTYPEGAGTMFYRLVNYQ